MSITAIVENGVIKLPAGAQLPDGTKVTIEPTEREDAGPTLAEQLAPFIGIWDGPKDLALSHDHYLYGAPKQQP